MVRIIDQDFESLENFCSNYTLVDFGTNCEFIACLKAGHKIYLSLLHVWSHCNLLVTNGSLKIHGIEIANESKEFAYFKECISDIGSGYFCCIHGAYKPGHMALRSGIENYLRFVAASFDGHAITTTSVFDLFNIAKSTPPFSAESAGYHTTLRENYVSLCKYSHSASLDHMSGIHALSHFPTFNAKAFNIWNDHATRICRAIACVLFFADRDIFLKAHFRTREVFELLLSGDERTRLLKGG